MLIDILYQSCNIQHYFLIFIIASNSAASAHLRYLFVDMFCDIKLAVRYTAFNRRSLSPELQSNLSWVTRNSGLDTGGCWVEHVNRSVQKGVRF